MKKQIAVSLLICSSFMTMACGQNPLMNIGGFSSTDIASEGWEPNIISNPYALLSAEQVFKSYASVTGVAPTGGITNDYNARQSILASGYDLKTVTSPMLISATNLASSFCQQAITNETALPVADRKLFSSVDFGRNVSNVSEGIFGATAEKLGRSFWGRAPSSVEMAALDDAKAEFIADLTTAEANNSNSSSRLMLFTCTAMLVSFDTISF